MKISLKAARVNAELRQAQVAEKLGITVDRVKYLESKEGSAKIAYSDLLTLCALYKFAFRVVNGQKNIIRRALV